MYDGIQMKKGGSFPVCELIEFVSGKSLKYAKSANMQRENIKYAM